MRSSISSVSGGPNAAVLLSSLCWRNATIIAAENPYVVRFASSKITRARPNSLPIHTMASFADTHSNPNHTPPTPRPGPILMRTPFVLQAWRGLLRRGRHLPDASTGLPQRRPCRRGAMPQAFDSGRISGKSDGPTRLEGSGGSTMRLLDCSDSGI